VLAQISETIKPVRPGRRFSKVAPVLLMIGDDPGSTFESE
jgi:hypothetical protein